MSCDLPTTNIKLIYVEMYYRYQHEVYRIYHVPIALKILRRKLFLMLLHTCYAKNYANIMNTGLYIVSKQSEVVIRG